MNGYDFDKTIYNKDSTVEFYLFLIRRRPHLIINAFSFGITFFQYKLGLKSKKCTKEKMFSIFKYFKNIVSKKRIMI